MQYDCYVTMEMQQTHCHTTGTITLLWKCNILIVTQQELLRYYGNAIWCIDHVTKENLICHNIITKSPKILLQQVTTDQPAN
jgi:hypothetical protein